MATGLKDEPALISNVAQVGDGRRADEVVGVDADSPSAVLRSAIRVPRVLRLRLVLKPAEAHSSH